MYSPSESRYFQAFLPHIPYLGILRFSFPSTFIIFFISHHPFLSLHLQSPKFARKKDTPLWCVCQTALFRKFL